MTKRIPIQKPEPKDSPYREPPAHPPARKEPPSDEPPREEPDDSSPPMKVGPRHKIEFNGDIYKLHMDSLPA